MELEQMYGLAGIPIVTGLIQALKATLPNLDSRYWPLLSLALATAFNVLLGWRMGTDLWTAAIVGVVAGLAASGLYSQAQTLGRFAFSPKR